MRELYAPSAPRVCEHLDVGGGHTLYVERCGEPGGIPIVFLHGGPGSGCKPEHRQFFDPARFDVVLLDQRGAGRSRPAGGIEGNDTMALVGDLEAVRAHFGVDAWALFAGSWGATLALAYAETVPRRVLGLVLRGSFLARRRDVDWFFRDGANRLLPREWQRFVAALAPPPGADLLDFMHARLFGGDPDWALAIARAWDAWSGAVVTFSLDAAGDGGVAGDAALSKTRIEMHYARHAYFLAENQLLDHAHRLPRVPTTIVHGARDLTCTADSALALHQAIPRSRLEILRTAGHLSSERPMIDALVRAADELADHLGRD